MPKVDLEQYHLRMVIYRGQNGVAIHTGTFLYIYYPIRPHTGTFLYIYYPIRPHETRLTLEEVARFRKTRTLRKFSDRKMAEEIIFKSPLASTYQRLKGDYSH